MCVSLHDACRIVFALAALKDSSIEEGDRIEHGSIITDEMIKEPRLD